jgi:hypothetical protein
LSLHLDLASLWLHLQAGVALANRVRGVPRDPLYLSVLSLLILWMTAHIGALLRSRWALRDDRRDDFSVVQAACLTTLGLLIGFSFSMAISRYDLRKNLEEAEANAIGTEYLRADLLPPQQAAVVRGQVRNYLALRIAFFKSRDEQKLRQITADTAQLQTQMWSAAHPSALAQPTAVIALAVSGMNDVLNSEGFSQAAWLNRIPAAAWALVMAVAICGNLLVGYGQRSAKTSPGLLLVLPLVVSISFLLIADIDTPRRGFIHVVPQNLVRLSED